MIGDSYTGNDFYCDVAIPQEGDLDVVHSSKDVLAFHHTKPHWQTHLVVVPKRHIGSMTTATHADAITVRALLVTVQAIAREVEEREGAAAVQTNLGAYQDSKHLHIHVYAGPLTTPPLAQHRRRRT